MKQTLSLKLGQQLTMTPQLQQAIKLLQLSALDLQQEIQTTLESNPMLEYEGDVGVEDDSEASADSELDDLAAPEATPQNLEDPMGGDLATDDFAAGSDDVATEDVASLPDGIGDDLPVDSSWEDVYPTTSSLPATDNDFDPLANRTAPTTLADHMVWQLNLTPMAPSDQVIAMSIIDALDSNGLLAQSTEEIWRGLVGEQSDEDASVDVDVDQISHDDVCAVLERLQAFDPLGVAARDLQECLLLQLKPLHEDTPWLDEATTLITDHLDLLGAKDFSTLRRRTKLSDAELAQVVDLIQNAESATRSRHRGGGHGLHRPRCGREERRGSLGGGAEFGNRAPGAGQSALREHGTRDGQGRQTANTCAITCRKHAGS